jgi:ORF6N domain
VKLDSDRVQQQIIVLRGQPVLLDSLLAALYAVEVRALLQAVLRNAERSPADFMFRLTREEWSALRSQTVISDKGRGRHRKYLPLAFTWPCSRPRCAHHVPCWSTLPSCAFVRMRRLIDSDARFAKMLRSLERRMIEHDRRFVIVFDAIRRILEPASVAERRRIGFRRAVDAGTSSRSKARRRRA